MIFPLLVVATAASLLSSCATVDQKIVLAYSPVERPFSRQSGEIAVSRVEPRTSLKNSKGEWIVGSINDANGAHKADILSDRSLEEWITDALLLELKRVGYNVSYNSSLPQGVAKGIVISDINAFLNIAKETVSDVIKHEFHFNMDVFLNGAKTKTFSVATPGTKTLLSASKEELEKIMLQSLQGAILQILPEIITLTPPK